MTFSRNRISLVCLFLISVLVTLGAVSSTALADSRYVVSKGDTLSEIAVTHHTSVTDLMKDNQLHTTLLQIHQVLWIPDSSRYSSAKPPEIPLTKKRSSQNEYHHIMIHAVHAGDTLWALAVENHTSVQSLIEMNHLRSELIYPGQKLKVYPTEQQLAVGLDEQEATRSIDLHDVSQKGIPVHLIPVYQAAGHKYGVPWTVLAAIHRTETGFSTAPVVSGGGAEGPMQFMPSTFEHYGVTAPGHHGAPDINNVYDAIYTAAHMLARDGYVENPKAAIYQYNHSIEYVKSIQTLAHAYQA